jgi:hypothetical protein
MTSPVDGFGERMTTPLFGPIISSFLIVNWQVLFWLLGAVAHPTSAVAGMKAWFAEVNYWHYAVFPIAGGLFWEYLVPMVNSKLVYPFQLYIERVRLRAKGHSDGLMPVRGDEYERALGLVDKLLLAIGESTNAINRLFAPAGSPSAGAMEAMVAISGSGVSPFQIRANEAIDALKDLRIKSMTAVSKLKEESSALPTTVSLRSQAKVRRWWQS